MTPAEAKKVLSEMRLSQFNDRVLFSLGWYLSVGAGEKATLDGGFTADELEAIAVWMRDPVKVMEAG